MNRVVLIGRPTKEIDMRQAGEMSVARFTLAVDRMKKEDPADFISCVAFGKTADVIGKYAGKGRRIAVEGRIQTGSYTNKDGGKVYTTDVVVERSEIIDWPEEEQKPAPAPKQAPKPETKQQQEMMKQAELEDFMQIPDDLEDEAGLPFD